MSILGPVGFALCMGVFVLYGLWTDKHPSGQNRI